MSLLDLVTGGKSGDASDAQRKALEQLQGVRTPDLQDLTLPELQQYAIAQQMTPAQMQAFLQQNNAYNDENIDQTGTDAQIKALNQLSSVADAGSEGSATQRAQVEQINQDAARNLAGQRGSIDQQAQARGVPVGLLQAALQSQRAGEGQQDAHMAALNAQSGAYQQALQAMAQGGALGGQLQGQQNTQANTVAAAQNAMQQFNAANQQQASGTNANFQQQANAANTQQANQTANANTGLANQRTQYNANLPQQNFQNQMQKATGVANQYGQIANTANQQGNQNSQLLGGILGAGATAFGGPVAGLATQQAVGYGNGPPAGVNTDQYKPKAMYADGGVIPPPNPDDMMRAMELMRSGKYDDADRVPGPAQGVDFGGEHPTMYDTASQGGVAHAKNGMMVPGEGKFPGDDPRNDDVNIRVQPGEAVIKKTTVQQNPMDVMRLLAGRPASTPRPNEPMPGHNPEDIAALLQAMKHLRGAH